MASYWGRVQNQVMRIIYSILLIFAVGLGYYFWTGQDNPVDYSTQVKPIINKHCISCHGGVKKNGGFSLLFQEEAMGDTKSGHPAIVPGDPENSPMIQRLKETDPELRMPYQKPPLTKQEIRILEDWIRQGAQWGEHWAYIPPIEPSVPDEIAEARAGSASSDFFVNEIDRFIYRDMESVGLKPSPRADTGRLVRRLYLDLIGLPPTTEVVDQIKNGSLSYEKVIDQLLDDPNFGEKWASWWLDLARYADTKGYEKDQSRAMWRFRDYVIQSFNQDKPFDEFTIEQLAGDLMDNPTREQLIATAFHRNTMSNDEGGTDDEEYRIASVIDRVNTTFEVWQSTTYACVQCHAHTYDPFKHEEYYEVMAFFNNSRDEDTADNEPLLRIYPDTIAASIEELKHWMIQNTNSPSRVEDEMQFIRTLEPKIHTHLCTDFVNGELSDTKYLALRHKGHCALNNTYLNNAETMVISYSCWKEGGRMTIRESNQEGKVITSFPLKKTNGNAIEFIPIAPMQDSVDLFIEFTNPLLDAQENSFRVYWFAFRPGLPGQSQPEFDKMNRKYREIIQSKPEGVSVMVENPPYMHRVTQVFEKGNWMVLGDTVLPDVPEVLNPFPENAPRNRLGLAQWLVDERNPLTARTVVNRIWQQIFGQGLVTTVEDLGSQSEPSVHSELLDWLAVRLMKTHDWHLKPLIRDIVRSGTYRQSSIISERKRETDPQNLYYSRGPRFRLSAEQIRDQALAVSGLLSDKQYGPSVMPPQPDGIWQTVYSGESWRTSPGEDRYRRGIYTFIKRTSPYPSFVSFDAGSREICITERTRTNTPLQALVTLNDPVYTEAAIAWASRLIHERASLEAILAQAYYEATFREISLGKKEALVKLYEESLAHFEGNQTGVKEYLKIGPDGLTGVNNHIELAALSVVCSAIMNLDEFLTKT